MSAVTIGLVGFKRTGKDTAAARFVDRGFTRVAQADTIREVAYQANPWVATDAGVMHRLATLVDGIGWEAAKDQADVRRFLVNLGQAGRTEIRQDVWTAAAERHITRHPLARYVVTDIRFIDEARRLCDLLVYVYRPGCEPDGSVTEQADQLLPWCVAHLRNGGTVADLHRQVDALVDLVDHPGRRRALIDRQARLFATHDRVAEAGTLTVWASR